MKSRRIALGSAVAAAAVAGALFVPGLASAHEKDPAAAQAKKDCLTAAGITKPERGTKPTQEQRDAIRAALAKCGIEAKARGEGPKAGGKHRGGAKRGAATAPSSAS